MTIDCNLKLDGVKGESASANHKNEIEVFGWNWDVSQPSSGSGGGQGLGKGIPGTFNFVHKYDIASPTLAKKCAKGEHFKDAVVTVRKAGGTQEDFLKVTMKTCFITLAAPSATAGGEIVETVHMTYEDIEFAYKPQDDKGGLGGEVKFGWNTKSTETR